MHYKFCNTTEINCEICFERRIKYLSIVRGVRRKKKKKKWRAFLSAKTNCNMKPN